MDADLRQFVVARANGRCEYCRFPEEYALLPFQVDHIIPKKLKGPTVEENLAWSCERCNSHKGPLISGFINGRAVDLFHSSPPQLARTFFLARGESGRGNRDRRSDDSGSGHQYRVSSCRTGVTD